MVTVAIIGLVVGTLGLGYAHRRKEKRAEKYMKGILRKQDDFVRYKQDQELQVYSSRDFDGPGPRN